MGVKFIWPLYFWMKVANLSMKNIIFLLLFKLAQINNHDSSVGEGAMKGYSEELLERI